MIKTAWIIAVALASLVATGCKPRKNSSLEAKNSSSSVNLTEDDLAAQIDFFGEMMNQTAGVGAIDTAAVDRARTLFHSGDYDQAAKQVSVIQMFLLAQQYQVDRVESLLKRLQNAGLVTDAQLQEYFNIHVRVYQGLQGKAGDPQMALSGYVLFENSIQLRLMQIDSEFYPFAKDLELLVTKSTSLLKKWNASFDRSNDVGALVQQSKEIDDDFIKIRTAYTATKYREMMAGKIQQLRNFKKVGSPTEYIQVNTQQINPAIEMFDKAGASYQNNNAAAAQNFVEEATSRLFPADLRTRLSDKNLFTLLTMQTILTYLSANCAECDQNSLMNLRNDVSALSQAVDEASFNDAYINAKKDLNLATNSISNPENRTKFFTQVLTEASIDHFCKQLSAYKALIRTTKMNYAKNGAGYKSSMIAIDKFGEAIDRLAVRARLSQDSNYIAGIVGQQDKIQLILFNGLEAATQSLPVADSYAEAFAEAIQGYVGTNNNVRLLSDASYQKLRSILKEENSEQQFRIWWNRQNAVTAAFSIILVAEAVSIVVDGPAGVVAMAGTSAFMRSLVFAGQVAVGTAKVVIAGASILNIMDRTRSQGTINGLFSFDSALDALNVFSILPRMPLPPAVKGALNTSLGRSIQQSIGSLQYASGAALVVGGSIFSGYQFMFAESIASDLNSQGYPVTANEIRFRACSTLAMSALAWRANSKYIAKERVNNPEAAAQLAPTTSIRESMLVKRLSGLVNPIGAAKSYYRANPSAFRAVLGGAGVVAAAGFDYVVVGEGVLLSYTNTTNNYMQQIESAHPFPDLKQGESALGLVGFAPQDAMLYFGAFSRGTNRRELALYKEKYSIDNFENADDILDKIAAYAKTHGKIKYLKIMTHGLPGALYTPAAEDAPIAANRNVRWINRTWLDASKAKIQAVAREAFADDARIVLFACLVGSNLDYAYLDGKTKTSENLDKGDDFMRLMSDAFLVNGGSIDASKRILNGIDAAYGDLIRNAANGGVKTANPRPMVPLFLLDDPNPAVADPDVQPRSLAGLSVSKATGSEQFFHMQKGQAKKMDITSSVAHLGSNITHGLVAMKENILKFGVQLEGPWWQNRYSYIEVKKH